MEDCFSVWDLAGDNHWFIPYECDYKGGLEGGLVKSNGKFVVDNWC